MLLPYTTLFRSSEAFEGVQLYVPVSEIDEVYINDMKSLMEKYQGNQKVRLTVFDKQKKEIQIGLQSSEGGVIVDNDFLNELEGRGYQYKVLTLNGRS